LTGQNGKIDLSRSRIAFAKKTAPLYFCTPELQKTAPLYFCTPEMFQAEFS
jgi:hypothetical protein